MATKRFWFWNKTNKMIIGLSFESFAEARAWAIGTNREGAHSTMGFIEFITDAPSITGGRITTVNCPVQMTLT